jgi:TonB family protein
VTSPVVRAAAAMVRVWTNLYTCGLRSEIRDRRREEIDADVWDQIAEYGTSPLFLAGHLISRAAFGIADDLGWRVAQRDARWSWVTAAVATALLPLGVGACVLFAPAPDPPAAPAFVADRRTPAPPPPPPPPPPPIGSRGSAPVDFTYAETSYIVIPESTPPVLVKEVRPIYPPILRANGVEGVVVVHGRITGDGRVAGLNVAEPTGLLAQSAIAAIRQWQFVPLDRSQAQSTRRFTVVVKYASGK